MPQTIKIRTFARTPKKNRNINTCHKGINQILSFDIAAKQEIKSPLQERLVLAGAERQQRRHLVLRGWRLSIDGKNCVVLLPPAVFDYDGEYDTKQIG
jgi:hypothetical protein